MRKLLHLSDLHFGRIDERLLDPLVSAADQIQPDLVVVSGDLTQRARPKEFLEAQLFLDRLPFPKLIVPGNHDVPINLFARFLWPLRNYRRYISVNPEPSFIDPEMAVLGINSARSFTIKSGRINSRQIKTIHEQFDSLPVSLFKIVVCHHPFHLPADCANERVIGRACKAVPSLAACGADVVLSGHFHVSDTAHSAERFNFAGHSTLLVQAGTATSTRLRTQTNRFNVLELEDHSAAIASYVWHPEKAMFHIEATDSFVRAAAGWLAMGAPLPT